MNTVSTIDFMKKSDKVNIQKVNLKSKKEEKKEYIEFVKNEKYASSNARLLTKKELEEVSDAGYLLSEEDIVVDIDCLDKELIRKILQEFNIITETVWTDRGAHLYFKKPSNYNSKWVKNSICSLGFKVEYLTKSTNPRGVCIKRFGEIREIENENVRQILPFLFNLCNRGKYVNCLGLAEGDGRNNNLFIQKQRLGYDEDAEKILRFINDNIFSEKLEEKELNTIIKQKLRDDNVDYMNRKKELTSANESSFDTKEITQNTENYVINTNSNTLYQITEDNSTIMKDRKATEHESFYAKALVEKLKITSYQNTLYAYYDDKWIKLDEDETSFIMRAIRSVSGDLNSTYFYKEVLAHIKLHCNVIEEDETMPILLKNKILQDEKVKDYENINYKPFSPYFIDIEYKENCERVEIVDEYLNNISNNEEQYKDFITEMLGYCLMTNRDFKSAFSKFFFVCGDGGNGKGTLLKVFSKILGKDNCSYASHEELSDERYLNNLKGKLANLADDVPDKPLNNSGVKILKNISSCDIITTRELYKNAQTTVLTCSLIFTTNHIIKSWEKDYAFKRRIVWIPLYFRPEIIDPLYFEKLTTDKALEYWLYLAIQGYLRLYKNKKFTESKSINDFTESYHKENNNLEVYIENKEVEDFVGKKPKTAYEIYESWCEAEGFETLSKKTFEGFVEKKFNLKKGSVRDGSKTKRVYKLK